MHCIFGIGNPGSRYKNNRHNAGFMLIDFFAEKHSLSFLPSKYDYYFSEGKLDDHYYLLVKPTTFVNNSGIAAAQVTSHYKINYQDFLVVTDDVNFNVGEIKVKSNGGDGGHNGVASIIYHLGTSLFPRIRIGIGNNFEKGEMAAFVLSDFTYEEKKILESSFQIPVILIENFIKGGTKQMFDANSKININKV